MKKSIRFLAYFQIIYALGIIIFWILFFLFDNNSNEKSEVFLAHERAFPVPDLGYLTPCLLVGSIGLLNRKNYGFLFSLLAGSSLIFLALLDTTFGILQGLFTTNLAEGAVYGFISVALLLFGIIIILVLWSNRKHLLLDI
jgi:hypothetical protein